MSPKDVRLLLSAFLMKFEVNCVKAMLRAKQAELDVDEAMNYIMPVGRLDEARCRKTLENSENIALHLRIVLTFAESISNPITVLAIFLSKPLSFPIALQILE